MKKETIHDMKRGMMRAIFFFLTLCILWVSAAWISMSHVNDGDTLTSSEWNKMIDNLEYLKSEVDSLSAWAWVDVDDIYPVGAIYISTSSTNPWTLFGGTWTAFGAGRTLVGLDSGQTEFDSVEETGGAKTHTLTVNEMPSHSHDVSLDWYWSSVGDDNNNTLWKRGWPRSYTTNSVWWNQPHNNLQPYIVVYMWKRTG